MATLALIYSNGDTVTYSNDDVAVVVSNTTPVRKGIVGGRVVVESNSNKGVFGSAVFTPLEEPARLTWFRTLIVGGKIYTADFNNRSVTIGGIVFEEYAQYVPAEESVAVGTGALTLSGYEPTVAVTNNITINVPVGSLSLTSYAPVTAVSIFITPDAGTLTLSGYAPVIDLSANHIRAPPVGTLVLTPYAPTLVSDFQVIDVDTDEVVYDGQPGVVVTTQNATSATGKRVFIEQGANFVEQTTVTGETLNTITITVTFGGVLTPGAATLYVWDPV